MVGLKPACVCCCGRDPSAIVTGVHDSISWPNEEHGCTAPIIVFVQSGHGSQLPLDAWLQGLVASIFVYTVTAPLPGLYILLRYSTWPEAWWASLMYWLLSVYLTFVSTINPPWTAPQTNYCKARSETAHLPRSSCSQSVRPNAAVTPKLSAS